MKRKHTTTESEPSEVKTTEEEKSEELQTQPQQGSAPEESSNKTETNNSPAEHVGGINANDIDDDDDDDDEIGEIANKIHANNANVPGYDGDNDDGDDDDDDDDDVGDLMGFGCSAVYQYAPGVLGFIPVEDQIKFSGLLCSQKQTPPTPLSKYRLLGNSGLRVSPCK